MPLRSALYLIQVSTLEYTDYVLKELDSTVINCHNEIKSGAYLFSNALLFLLPGINGTEVKNKVFANKHIRLHKHVATLDEKTKGTLIVEAFNIYQNTTQSTLVMKLSDNEKVYISDMFPDFDMNVCTEFSVYRDSSKLYKNHALTNFRVTLLEWLVCHIPIGLGVTTIQWLQIHEEFSKTEQALRSWP